MSLQSFEGIQIPVNFGIPRPVHPDYQKEWNEAETEMYLDRALRSAWEQYGGPAKDKVKTSFNRRKADDEEYSQHDAFQSMDSEWDQKVQLQPVGVETPKLVLKPGLFSRLISSYIHFEVDNHEFADFVRKIIVTGIVVLVAFVWISIGIGFGMFPMIMPSGSFLGGSSGKFASEKTLFARNVSLELDSSWLTTLKDLVLSSQESKSLRSKVLCCIVPGEIATAECSVYRKKKNLNAFDCVSDLVYNLEFGPKTPRNHYVFL